MLVGTALCMMKNNQNTLSEMGILMSKSDSNVILLKDSVLVTLIYDLGDVRSMWNEYISELESMSVVLNKNDCIENILVACRQSRFYIKEFLDSLNTTSKYKRQAILGVVGGLTSLVSFGLTSYELVKVNEKISEIRESMTHNENSIEILNSVTRYNSKQLNELVRVQSHTNIVLKSMKEQFLMNIDKLNELRTDMICLNVKMSFMSLSGVIDRIMVELRNLLSYKFDSRLISYSVRESICKDLHDKGFQVYGNCVDFDLIEEVNFLSLESNKLVIITKLPIMNNLDVFSVITLTSLPIKINGKFYQIKNLQRNLAVGDKFRTSIDIKDCTKFNKHLFCKPLSEYRN